LSRKIVRGAERDDAERRIRPVQSIHDFVERAVAAHCGHNVGAFGGGRSGQRDRVAALKRHAHIDVMSAFAYPVDHVPKVGSAGPTAVSNKSDVFALRRRHVSS
jgi:hypothetical protein